MIHMRMLRLCLLMPLFLASSGFYASLPVLNSRKPKKISPRLVHGTTMMSFSAEAPISSWDKHQLKAELTKINLEGSATILHSANVDGLTLLRATEKYGLASVYNLKIAEAVQIEAYAEKKRKEDERIEAELRKRMEKDKEKQSESHLLVSFTTMS
jgi:dsDNA-binding SOS-regulon protein